MQFEFFCQIYWSFSSSFKYVENREQGDQGVSLQRVTLHFSTLISILVKVDLKKKMKRF